MDRLEELLRLVSAFMRSERGRRLERIVGTLLFVGLLLFLLTILVQSWPQIVPYLGRMNGWLLLAGQACTFLALLLGGVMWSLIQAAFGLGFSWREGVVVHCVSGVTKYVPGYAWQYISKAYLSRKQGAPPRRIVVAMLTEFILLLAGGLIAAVLWGSLASYFQYSLPLAWPVWGWALIGVVALSGVIFWNIAAGWLIANNCRMIRQELLWLSLGISVIGWMVLSGAAWLISRSFYPVSLYDFPQYGIAVVVSGIVSLLAFVVPGGLGVRETAMVLLLRDTVPFALGVVVSILVRFSVVFGEIVGIGIIIGLHLWRLPSSEQGAKISDKGERSSMR